jgi:MFS family permease
MGTGVTTIALALLAWKLGGAGAGRILGTVLALKMVVYVVLSPLITAKADKLPRRSWLIAMDLVRAGMVALLPFVTEVRDVYLILLVVYACSAGFTPVFQAAIPDVVPDEDSYNRALSLSRIAYNLEALLSPVLAAALLKVLSFNNLFVLDALTFAASALLVLSCRLPRAERGDRPDNWWYNARFGVTAYLRTPRLRAILLMYTAVASASAMVIVNTVLYVRDALGGDESQTAVAYGAAGLGSMLVAFLLPAWLRRAHARTVLLSGCALLAAGLWLCLLRPPWPLFLALWFCIGVGLSIVQTPVGAVVRRSCNDSDTSAYFAAQFSLSHLCWLGAYLLAGWVGAQAGFATAATVLAAVATVGAVCAWRVYPNPDADILEHTHTAIIHDHPHSADEHHQPHLGHSHAHDTDAAHDHKHEHKAITHSHRFVIDHHHQRWPNTG